MKKNGISREELGKKVFVTKRTVDGWLSAGKPIPSAKMELIERIVADSENIQFDLPENIELLLKQKAKEAHKSIDDLVIEILEKTVKEIKKKQQASGMYPEALKSYTLPWTTMTSRKRSTTSSFAPSNYRKSWLSGTSLQGKSRGAILASPTRYLTKVSRRCMWKERQWSRKSKTGRLCLSAPCLKMQTWKNMLMKLSFTTAETVYPASRSRGWWLMTRATSSLSLSTRLSGGAFPSPVKSKLAWLARLT